MTGNPFYTIAKPGSSEHEDRGSKFYGRSFQLGTADELTSRIEETCNELTGASHYCYAYVLGDPDTEFRVSDDGEPSGTAGLPILTQIKHFRVVRTLVIVVRYFGGTRLGTGGLVRAYGKAAELALVNAGRSKHYPTIRVDVSFPYEMSGVVERVIGAFGAAVLSRSFSDVAMLTVEMRVLDLEAFKEQLANASAGKVTFLREYST